MRDLIKRLKYYLRYILISDEKYIKYKFKKYFGYELNLKEPKTLNEKLQWLKLYDRTPLHTKCADKFLVREYIKEKVGEKCLVPLIFDTFNPTDINEQNLPDFPVVVKVNHSRGVFLINDKTKIDFDDIQKKLGKELKTNFYYRTREWQYKDIKPRIIIEKMLLDKNNNIPDDYKFICINGEIAFIQVDMNRFNGHKKTIYDKYWNKQNFGFNYPIGNDVEKPATLEQMVKTAELISKDFCFVRVDFYTLNNEIYIGELTFHPAGGFGKFDPENVDFELGKKLNLGIINE